MYLSVHRAIYRQIETSYWRGVSDTAALAVEVSQQKVKADEAVEILKSKFKAWRNE